MQPDKISAKRIIVNQITQSTVHGFPKIVSSTNKSIKFLWTFFLFCSIGGCGYLVALAISEYLEFNVTTRIRVEPQKPLVYPVITICNKDPFVGEKSYEILNNFTNNAYYDDYLYSLVASSKEFGIERKKSLGIPLEEMIPENTTKFSYIPVGYDKLEWYFHITYGNCYRFNTGDNQTLYSLKTAGKFFGFETVLFTGVKKYKNRSIINAGMQVLIDNQNDIISYSGIDIPAGQSTHIALTKTITKRLPKPFSRCVDLSNFNSEIYDFMIKSRKRYNQQNCVFLCYQKLTNERCNCTDTSIEMYRDLPGCVNLESSKNCYDQINELFNNEGTDFCNDMCPLECESSKFDYSLTFSEFPIYSYNLDNIFKFDKYDPDHKLTDYEIKSNFVFLSISFDKLEYTVIEEFESLSMVSLISNIGGTLGLFLGMSLLSLVEILETILEICLIKIRKNSIHDVN